MSDQHDRSARLAWHYLEFDVPPAWEVTGYKKDPRKGRLVLSDRYGQTMLVYWKQEKEEPVPTRRLADLAEANCKDLLSPKEIRQRIEGIAGWKVFLPGIAGQPVFAGRYLKKEKALLSVTFPPHPATDNQRSARRVLKSYRPNTGDERAWAAFGLDITLPAEWELSEVEPLPGMQKMTFENAREEAITVYRFGMMPDALRGEPPEVFFARARGQKLQLYETGRFVKDGKYPGVQLSYETRGKTGGLMSLLARMWRGQVHVWLCEDVRRLFCVEQHSRKQTLIEGLPDRVREVRAETAAASTACAANPQLAVVPAVNAEAAVRQTDEGKFRLSVPLRHRGWSKALGLVLPLSKEKNLELDRLGGEMLALFDGTRTLEQIIDLHAERWKLSFFEARAMVVQFIQSLMKYSFVALVAPERK